MTRRALLAVCLIVAAVGCSSDGPGAPSDRGSPFAGTWIGTLTDGAAGQGSLTFELAGDPVATAGTWTVTRGRQSTTGRALTLSSSTGGSVVHRVSADCLDGGGFWLATVSIDGRRMTGTYNSFGCPGFTAGALDVVRQ
jgi:hypothetical protein